MTPKVRSIEAELLLPDPSNPNVCGPDEMAKLKANIQETGFYTPIVAIHHPSLPDSYLIVDGHHRVMALKELGKTSIRCFVDESITPQKARLLLASLNRLRGQDNPRKRAELMEELLELYDKEVLSSFLMESVQEIDDLLLLIRQDEEEQRRRVKASLEDLDSNLPELLSFLVDATHLSTVKQALDNYQPQTSKNPADGLVAIAEFVLSHHVKETKNEHI